MRYINSMNKTYLIVGLGNPGKEYKNTRHNAGFCSIDLILKDLKLELDKKKYNALYTVYKENNNKYIFVEPQTYMNSSGEAVVKLCDFYKIDPKEVIIIYDDMDLPLGKVRLRNSGSSGGHNGVKSIIECLHTEEIKRIRLGISKDSKIEVIDYVLGRFKGEELKLFKSAHNTAKDAIKYLYKKEQYEQTIAEINAKTSIIQQEDRSKLENS